MMQLNQSCDYYDSMLLFSAKYINEHMQVLFTLEKNVMKLCGQVVPHNPSPAWMKMEGPKIANYGIHDDVSKYM